MQDLLRDTQDMVDAARGYLETGLSYINGASEARHVGESNDRVDVEGLEEGLSATGRDMVRNAYDCLIRGQLLHIYAREMSEIGGILDGHACEEELRPEVEEATGVSLPEGTNGRRETRTALNKVYNDVREIVDTLEKYRNALNSEESSPFSL